jgi:HSP20 family molecular chaperone IbpA
VNLSDGGLTIKGEKHEEKEEKKEGYHLHERHFGSFQATSACQKASIPTRSRRASRTACSP